MNRLQFLVVLGFVVGCGAAADDAVESTDDITPEVVARETPERVSHPKPVATTPEPTVDVAPEYRTCKTDDDCTFRSNVCGPLVVGGPLFCRQAMAPDGAACGRDEDCDVGLFCRAEPGNAAETCQACPVYVGGPSPVCERRPLVCDRVGAEPTQDADCEVLP